MKMSDGAKSYAARLTRRAFNNDPELKFYQNFVNRDRFDSDSLFIDATIPKDEFERLVNDLIDVNIEEIDTIDRTTPTTNQKRKTWSKAKNKIVWR